MISRRAFFIMVLKSFSYCAKIFSMVSQNKKMKMAVMRDQMVESTLVWRDIVDKRVLEVMGKVEREEFVSEKYQDQAYSDSPLPIGLGQTVSQPYIVALMTQLLGLEREDEVLEIGTGCGYQSAVLAELVKRVYTVERFEELGNRACSTLSRLGYKNIEYYIGDGSLGWPGEMCFDKIILTAAAPCVPEGLFCQLNDGGVMVLPIGSESVQELVKIQRVGADMVSEKVCGCRFVRLIGEEGFKE